MDLQKLRYFVAVAEELHFSNAARRLYVSQPALSRAIRGLEQSLRVQLFERSTRRVELTAAGVALLPDARRLLAAAAALDATVAEQRRPAEGRFVVGLLDEGAAELTGPIVAAFRSRNPGLSVHVRSLPYGPHEALLERGEVDAILGPDVAFDRKQVVTTQSLFVDGRLAVLPATSPMADADRVAAAAILDQPMVRPMGPSQPMIDHFYLADLRNAEPPRTTPGDGLMTDLLHQVSVDGVTMTVTTATGRFYSHPGVVFRPLPDVPETASSVVTRRVDPDRDAPRPLHASFVATAQATARQLIGLVPGARLPDVSPETATPGVSA